MGYRQKPSELTILLRSAVPIIGSKPHAFAPSRRFFASAATRN